MHRASRLFVMFLGAAMVSCAQSRHDGDAVLTPTIYFKPKIIVSQSSCEVSEKKALISKDGATLASLCPQDYEACLLQGSCYVDDGSEVRSYNYHSTKSGRAIFFEVNTDECPYGYGVQNICLDPYFTVAADLNFYKTGDVLFVPILEGLRLPDGTYHDGFVIVRDSGGSIRGKHRFDFFTGVLSHRSKTNPLAQLGLGDPKKRFKYRLASADERSRTLEQRAFPLLPPVTLSETQQILIPWSREDDVKKSCSGSCPSADSLQQ